MYTNIKAYSTDIMSHSKDTVWVTMNSKKNQIKKILKIGAAEPELL